MWLVWVFGHLVWFVFLGGFTHFGVCLFLFCLFVKSPCQRRSQGDDDDLLAAQAHS